MRIDYIKNFIIATQEIIGEFIGNDELQIDEPQLCGEHHSMMGFAVIVGLTGDVEGRIVLDMEEETAVKIANLVNETDFTNPGHELVQSTIQELGNMISGRAITLLNEMSCLFDITPPVVVVGRDMVLSDIGHEIVSTPVKTKMGLIDMTLVVYEPE